MPLADSPCLLQSYPGYRNFVTSASTIQTDTSATSQTIEYDAEAAQMKGHSALYGRVHPLNKASSLGKNDAGIFQTYLEKGPPKRRVESGEALGREKFHEHSLLASTTSSFELQEDIPKSERNTVRLICKTIFILLVLGVLWIPGILSWTDFPYETIFGVPFLFWSIWLTLVWAGFWSVIAVSYLTPSIFKPPSTVSSVHRWQHIHEVRAAYRFRGILFWSSIIWMSYQPLIVKNLPIKAPAEDTATLNLISRLLLGNLICMAFLTLEKVSIQRITEKFHEKSYAQRIQALEKFLQALCILYKHTVDVVVRPHTRNSEIMLDLSSNTGSHDRKHPSEQLKGASGQGHCAGFSALHGQAPEPLVRMALSTPSNSRLLGRRLFYSFSRPNTDYVVAEDIATFCPTLEDTAIAFAFFDRGGDMSREELEATCLEVHQEQVAITDSMRDMNTALSRLDNIMMSLCYVACTVVIAVVMDIQIAPLIAGVCALVLGLSWLVGASFQEVMTSIIFLFAKHPFDVGDSVIIRNESYTVKEIKLLSTVFLDTNSTLIQVSNHQLNNLFIHNSRRSSHVSETFMFDVRYSTTFQEVDKIREKMLEFVKSEHRDFQPVFDVMVQDFTGQSRMILAADIKYKNSIAGLKAMRRNKWLCALKSTLSDLHVHSHTGCSDSATVHESAIGSS